MSYSIPVRGTYALHCGNDKHKTYGCCRISSQKREMMKDLRSKTMEELQVIQNERAANGCYTEYAIEAQKMIYKKHNYFGEA